MHLKMSFAKWRPFCLVLNVLTYERNVRTAICCIRSVSGQSDKSNHKQWVCLLHTSYILHYQVTDLTRSVGPNFWSDGPHHVFSFLFPSTASITVTREIQTIHSWINHLTMHAKAGIWMSRVKSDNFGFACFLLRHFVWSVTWGCLFDNLPDDTLHWRHNAHDGVSNHQPYDCLLSRLFRRRSKKTSKLRITGLCEGNSPVTGEFPAQMASNAENVSIWWRHHELIDSRIYDEHFYSLLRATIEEKQ